MAEVTESYGYQETQEGLEEVVPGRPLRRAVTAIERDVERLSKTIGELRERLEPVLGPADAADDQAQSDVGVHQGSDTTRALLFSAQMIRNLDQGLAGVLDRLEV